MQLGQSRVRGVEAQPPADHRAWPCPRRPIAHRPPYGLAVGQLVILSCQYADGLGTERQSHATFRADAEGTVNPASQAPISGTYIGIDPMGLIWSVASLATPTDIADLALIGFLNPNEVTFAAKIGQRVVAQASVQRYFLSLDFAL